MGAARWNMKGERFLPESGRLWIGTVGTGIVRLLRRRGRAQFGPSGTAFPTSLCEPSALTMRGCSWSPHATLPAGGFATDCGRSSRRSRWKETVRIARAIHVTLSTNLAGVAPQSAIGRTERDRPELAAEHFGANSATAGELVQSLDGIVWAVNPAHDTLASLARCLMRFAEEFCAALPARLRLDVADELSLISLRSRIRHNIPLAARECRNNAERHSGASEILPSPRPLALISVAIVEENELRRQRYSRVLEKAPGFR